MAIDNAATRLVHLCTLVPKIENQFNLLDKFNTKVKGMEMNLYSSSFRRMVCECPLLQKGTEML